MGGFIGLALSLGSFGSLVEIGEPFSPVERYPINEVLTTARILYLKLFLLQKTD